MEGAGAQDEAPSALGLLGMLLLANGTEIGLGVQLRFFLLGEGSGSAVG